MRLSPREEDNITIKDGYPSVIRLDIIYDGVHSRERTWIISPYEHGLSDLETRLFLKLSHTVDPFVLSPIDMNVVKPSRRKPEHDCE